MMKESSCKENGPINCDFFSPFRFPERVENILSLAGNAYFTQAEVDGMIGLKDVSQWSEEWSNLIKMQWTTQRSLEDIYGKVIFSYILEIEQMVYYDRKCKMGFEMS